MPVDDLWYLGKRGSDGKRLPSKRHGRGKRWRVRYIDDAGLPKQKLFERRVDADRYDATMRADVARGVYIDPGAGRKTVGEYAQEWRVAQLHRDNTAARIEYTVRIHIEPRFGRVPFASVRHSHVQAWVRERSTVLASSSMRVVFHVFQAICEAAVRDRIIGRNPCDGVRLPELVKEDMWIPKPEQVHALADAMLIPPPPGKPARDRYRAQIFCAAAGGLRQGEIWGLELEHLDFDAREIRVVQQLLAPPGKLPQLAPPKTATSARTVEMGDVLSEELKRHLERHPPKPVMILDATDSRRPRMREAMLMFVTPRGNPMRRSTWSYPWSAVVNVVPGVPDDFSMHGLRHFYATMLIAAGASVKTVQLALGHATPTITLNTYLGLWPDALDTTRGLVDAALRRG